MNVYATKYKGQIIHDWKFVLECRKTLIRSYQLQTKWEVRSLNSDNEMRIIETSVVSEILDESTSCLVSDGSSIQLTVKLKYDTGGLYQILEIQFDGAII